MKEYLTYLEEMRNGYYRNINWKIFKNNIFIATRGGLRAATSYK